MNINSSAASARRLTVMPILIAISLSHLLNDAMQSMIPSIYPMIKILFKLNFSQVGLITFVYQLTASLLQPLVGAYTDRRPKPFILAIGMCFTLTGLIMLSFVNSYPLLLLSVAVIGSGSSIFHPESSRVGHIAAGERKGFAQSFFQVGGNFGTSLGPLLVALFIVNRGRGYIAWFAIFALIGIIILIQVGRWYNERLKKSLREEKKSSPALRKGPLDAGKTAFCVTVLVVLIFSKYIYLSSLNSFYMFYLMEKFSLTIRNAQIHLFIFQLAVAAGTLMGGPIGDKIGRKYVIWISILGAAPFTLVLPYVGLTATTVLTVFIGLILSSAFSAILVYAHELIPGKVGLISGLFFGLAFGIAGIGSATLGLLADKTSLTLVYRICSFLPLIGLLAAFLPDIKNRSITVKEVEETANI